MADLFGTDHSRRIAVRKIKGGVSGLYIAAGGNFITQPADRLDCDSGGIIGDHHYGLTRKAGGREPWYGRGVLIRNDRQVSLVCRRELAKIAAVMGITEIKPEWIGANIVVDDIADFTLLPAGTVLFFEGGLTLKLDGRNAPCKKTGASIARSIGAVDEALVALEFVKAAQYLRGQTGWVERQGAVALADKITARVSEQICYAPD